MSKFKKFTDGREAAEWARKSIKPSNVKKASGDKLLKAHTHLARECVMMSMFGGPVSALEAKYRAKKDLLEAEITERLR